ncbi:MAG TPA: hypothetical protein VMU32_09410 [Solirubrobacteraceae bacterium]|nr:hypothetical protein [Solirubrobacteraceae bacterium]
MSEPLYGTTKTAEPIPVPRDRPFVTSTPNPTAAPDQAAMKAYYAIVSRDFRAQHQQHLSGPAEP